MWPTKTNEDGIYAFPRIPAGDYELRVEAQGFKSCSCRRACTLELNQRARLDCAHASRRRLTESVSVTAEAALLQTDTTQVGTQINPQTIDHTPLISRNPIALTLLAPGVITPNPATLQRRPAQHGRRPAIRERQSRRGQQLPAGRRRQQPHHDNLIAYQPNPDAIEEFSMITNNASAEFGNFQGGMINVVIKSGTNQFHGNVFEVLPQRQTERQQLGQQLAHESDDSRALLRWNQFGGTFGGPIIKDKLFFFADYQGLRKATPPVATSFSVMPADWRQGDFSRLLDPVPTCRRHPALQSVLRRRQRQSRAVCQQPDSQSACSAPR